MSIRKRIIKSSIAGQLATFESLRQEMPSPLALSPREHEFFVGITESREQSTWTPVDLFQAATLAKIQRRIEETSRELDEVGHRLGEDPAKPSRAFLALGTYLSQSVTLVRALGLTGADRGLLKPEQQSRNRADTQARDVLNRASHSDLLA